MDVLAGAIVGGVVAAFISHALGWPIWPGLIVSAVYVLGMSVGRFSSR